MRLEHLKLASLSLGVITLFALVFALELEWPTLTQFLVSAAIWREAKHLLAHPQDNSQPNLEHQPLPGMHNGNISGMPDKRHPAGSNRLGEILESHDNSR